MSCYTCGGTLSRYRRGGPRSLVWGCACCDRKHAVCPHQNFDSLYRAILKLLPRASCDEDSQGQLVIYTDLQVNADEKLELFSATEQDAF